MEKSSRQWVLLQIAIFAPSVLVVCLLHEWRKHVKKKKKKKKIEVVFFSPSR
jgi:predicted nucleic acid-binding protein